MAQEWNGQSRGTILGYKIMIAIFKYTHIRVAYFFLLFVSTWYFLFAKSRRWVDFYYKHILNYKGAKAFVGAWKTYYVFAQTLVDKFASMAGARKFSIQKHGMHYLDELAKNGKGAILISAHIGNWEVAGNMLNRLPTKFNILMYDNERQAMKQVANNTMVEKRLNIIAIDNENMSHLIAINESFRKGEMLVMHGDRFVEGAQVVEKNFMGKKADFPTGPFYLAARFGVPVCFVFALKSGSLAYTFYANQPIQVEKQRDKEKISETVSVLLEQYILTCENMLKKYPNQWFNFYSYWKN